MVAVTSPSETDLLYACAALRAKAREWEDRAARLREEIDAELCVKRETEHAARLHRQAAHLELCAAIVRGTAGTDTAAPARAPSSTRPASGAPCPLPVLELLAVTGEWEAQADHTADQGRRALLHGHASEIGGILASVPQGSAQV
jgi:hypothetical protein